MDIPVNILQHHLLTKKPQMLLLCYLLLGMLKEAEEEVGRKVKVLF